MVVVSAVLVARQDLFARILCVGWRNCCAPGTARVSLDGVLDGDQPEDCSGGRLDGDQPEDCSAPGCRVDVWMEVSRRTALRRGVVRMEISRRTARVSVLVVRNSGCPRGPAGVTRDVLVRLEDHVGRTIMLES